MCKFRYILHFDTENVWITNEDKAKSKSTSTRWRWMQRQEWDDGKNTGDERKLKLKKAPKRMYVCWKKYLWKSEIFIWWNGTNDILTKRNERSERKRWNIYGIPKIYRYIVTLLRLFCCAMIVEINMQSIDYSEKNKTDYSFEKCHLYANNWMNFHLVLV